MSFSHIKVLTSSYKKNLSLAFCNFSKTLKTEPSTMAFLSLQLPMILQRTVHITVHRLEMLTCSLQNLATKVPLLILRMYLLFMLRVTLLGVSFSSCSWLFNLRRVVKTENNENMSPNAQMSYNLSSFLSRIIETTFSFHCLACVLYLNKLSGHALLVKATLLEIKTAQDMCRNLGWHKKKLRHMPRRPLLISQNSVGHICFPSTGSCPFR